MSNSTPYSVKFLVKKNNYASNHDCASEIKRSSCAAAIEGVNSDKENAWIQGGYKKPTQDMRKKMRVICAPNQDLKIKQKEILQRLSWIPVHNSSYGFVRGRNSYDCAQSHLLYWGKRDRGLVFLNIDLENFFHSISESEIQKALSGHGMNDEEVSGVIDTCLARITPEFLGRVVETAVRNSGSFPGVSRNPYHFERLLLDASNICPDIKNAGKREIFNIKNPKWGFYTQQQEGLYVRTQKRIDLTVFKTLRDTIQCRCTPGFFESIVNLEEQLKSGAFSPQIFKNWGKDDHIVVSKFIMEFFLGVPNGVVGGLFLPQGAPTSPAITNLVMKVVDIRLSAMAKAFGAYYTRYADDLTFSWPYFTKGRVVDGLKRCVTEVVGEYGLKPNSRKIKVMGPGQRQDIVGYCVNSGKPTINSKYRKSLRRAILWSQTSGNTDQFERLMGMAGYVGSAHPEESDKMKSQILSLKNHHSIGRKVVVPGDHEETHATDTEYNVEQYTEEAAYPSRFVGEY
jgi:hypothetical protein